MIDITQILRAPGKDVALEKVKWLQQGLQAIRVFVFARYQDAVCYECAGSRVNLNKLSSWQVKLFEGYKVGLD